MSLLYFSGGTFAHSLSWHRKGDHIAGCKLYARVWTPEDPRINQKGFVNGLSYTTEHTRLWSLSLNCLFPSSPWNEHASDIIIIIIKNAARAAGGTGKRGQQAKSSEKSDYCYIRTFSNYYFDSNLLPFIVNVNRIYHIFYVPIVWVVNDTFLLMYANEVFI